MLLGQQLVARARNLDLHHGGQAGLVRGGVGAQRDDAVAEVNGFFEVVGDKQHGQSGAAHQARHFILQALTGHGIERTKGLVHHHQLRLLREAARDLHPLLHAAGELCRKFGGVCAQAHGVEHLGDAVRTLLRRHAGCFERQADVARHGAPGQQCTAIVLKHKRHFARRAGDGLAVAQCGTATGLQKPGCCAQERGLAATGRANDADEFAACHLERGGREYFAAAQVDAHLVEPQQGRFTHRGRLT